MAPAMIQPASAMAHVAFVPDVHVRLAPTVRTYRRRRSAVLLAVIVAAIVLPVAASRAAAAFRDVPASVSERRPAPASLTPSAASAGSGTAAGATAATASAGYVVQPGDTLWSIARRLQPEGDVRALVHQLARANGGADLEVGQRLVIP